METPLAAFTVMQIGLFIGEAVERRAIIAQAMTLGVFASALLHPLCIAVTMVFYVLFPIVPENAPLGVIIVAGLNIFILVAGYIFILVAGYAVTAFIGYRALALRGFRGWAGTIATLPLYWLLMSCAAWYALWQFIAAPFHWNKTEHGLSRRQRGRRAKAKQANST